MKKKKKKRKKEKKTNGEYEIGIREKNGFPPFFFFHDRKRIKRNK